MADQDKNTGLSDEELQDQQASELPDREAMSLINANLAAPVNARWQPTCCPTTR